MSCFSGKLKEYQSFSVDCFDKNNLDSNVYFLSHCHQDHMNGLDSPTFLNRLKTSQNVLVYCSETTRNILLSDLRYKHLDNYLAGLPVEHPTTINVKNELNGKSESVCVTLLPAGHCIGSVMFLFEGNNGTVLYTGDFRLSKGDASRIPFFHSGDSIKDITSIYVDTTFCLSQMNHIPNREATKNAVLRLIKRWLSHGPNYYVSLLCKGMYGYEYLLKEVAIALKTKIHVSPERLTLYSNLPDMIEHFTTQAKMTKIHSCNWERDRPAFSKMPCGLTLPAPQKIKVMKIKASSMWFARRKEPLPIDCVFHASKDFYRVVHSMHASMEEIVDLVGYLRPLYVYPTVEPAGLYTIKQAQESLQRFTKFNGCDASKTDNSEEVGFQERSVVSNNQSMVEETPALYEDQKLSKSSWISHSNNLPSEEVTWHRFPMKLFPLATTVRWRGHSKHLKKTSLVCREKQTTGMH